MNLLVLFLGFVKNVMSIYCIVYLLRCHINFQFFKLNLFYKVLKKNVIKIVIVKVNKSIIIRGHINNCFK